ncbi:SDR family oxidoreductase [Streptomyces sp. NPDC052721]|uniref:SDR family oxidoreductase n=1 Tax=Streptomyces sp. NPDC052721 TaxID=3154955 RepID=UPI00341CF6FD
MPQTVLVTGTSSGLGRRTAEVLAERGHTVVATMRAPQGKDRAAAETLIKTGDGSPGRILVVEMDVRDDESVDAGVAAAIERAGGLDAVVNNAAYAITGIGESVTSSQLLDVLDTNLVGPQRVTRAVLPHLRPRRSGLLVFLSSGAGRLTVPGMGAYSASKSGLEALAQAYRYELRPLGIDVSIVQPGAFPSNLAASQVAGADENRLADYAEVLQLAGAFMQQIGAIFAGPQPPDPREVADAVADLVDTPSGQRPERVSVDRFMLGRAVTAINAGTKAPTDALLRELDLGAVVS